MTAVVSRVACMRLLGGALLPQKPEPGATRLCQSSSSKPSAFTPYRRLTLRITRPPAPSAADNRGVSRVACMRLLDCAIFSAPPATLPAGEEARPTPCLTRLAPVEVRPHTMAGGAAITPLRHPARPRIQPTVIPHRPSNLTLGITRRPERLVEHENSRVGGRVHAVVRLRSVQTVSASER